MARIADRLPENADGDFFVDASCIDCGTCWRLAPDLFDRSDASDRAFVRRQPATGPERLRAAMALVACPTSSIGAERKLDEVAEAARAFPVALADNVFFCGYTSSESFAAWSYLVRRPSDNLLVDSPRAARPLLARLDELGGVRRLFLSHRDDVADHAVLHARFGCERILHRDDRSAGTRDVERLLEGRDPVRLDDDLVAIPVPGHTRGSTALLYADTFLFTGDHLWWSESDGRLDASRSVCWYSWPEQLRSLERLLDFRFEWVLPGHGGIHRAPSARAMRELLERAIVRLRGG
jgi:glyoxylase-like metal-dependent hydrolase (beta-lactamase superfamily II)/ferredoxin